MGRRSISKRMLGSIALVASVMVVGMVGLHYLEGLSYLDAFYFMSMLATTQGPLRTPTTPAGKVFVAIIAFVSVGSIVTALASLFGPFWVGLWHTASSLEEGLRDVAKKADQSGEVDDV
jgi:hypothetical protein